MSAQYPYIPAAILEPLKQQAPGSVPDIYGTYLKLKEDPRLKPLVTNLYQLRKQFSQEAEIHFNQSNPSPENNARYEALSEAVTQAEGALNTASTEAAKKMGMDAKAAELLSNILRVSSCCAEESHQPAYPPRIHGHINGIIARAQALGTKITDYLDKQCSAAQSPTEGCLADQRVGKPTDSTRIWVLKHISKMNTYSITMPEEYPAQNTSQLQEINDTLAYLKSDECKKTYPSLNTQEAITFFTEAAKEQAAITQQISELPLKALEAAPDKTPKKEGNGR